MPLTTPATKLVATSTTAAELVAAAPTRTALYITNEDASITVRIGDSTVENGGGTAANVGLAIMAGDTLVVAGASEEGAPDAKAQFYVIADSGTPNVSVMELFSK